MLGFGWRKIRRRGQVQPRFCTKSRRDCLMMVFGSQPRSNQRGTTWCSLEVFFQQRKHPSLRQFLRVDESIITTSHLTLRPHPFLSFGFNYPPTLTHASVGVGRVLITLSPYAIIIGPRSRLTPRTPGASGRNGNTVASKLFSPTRGLRPEC